MKHVKKSVLLWYSAREMYDLVVDIEHYPRFLPWCESATVLERHGPADTPGSTDGMTQTDFLACPIGSYCVNGVKYACPAGTYNTLTSQSSIAACSRPCRRSSST